MVLKPFRFKFDTILDKAEFSWEPLSWKLRCWNIQRTKQIDVVYLSKATISKTAYLLIESRFYHYVIFKRSYYTIEESEMTQPFFV